MSTTTQAATEAASPAGTAPLLAAKEPAEEPCPDCLAPAGEDCTATCPNRTEPVERPVFEAVDPDYEWWSERADYDSGDGPRGD
jgi:hypothetical protein